MTVDDLVDLLASMEGVRHTVRSKTHEWRLGGRLVARQLDPDHVVVRAEFAVRDDLVARFPETFSVPTRFVKHMMVVADLANGDSAAIEDALVAAWSLQRRSG